VNWAVSTLCSSYCCTVEVTKRMNWRMEGSGTGANLFELSGPPASTTACIWRV
jgi:hypothetical protein